MTHKIPEAALADHIAVVGKTGSGKTFTAKGIVEDRVAEEYRVCVLDPIKSDWWGLTLSSSGKRPGLPFDILGGPRGHVELNPQSGKIIAKLVARGELPLSVLDMKHFKPGEHQRFFIDFAETLLNQMRGVVYLVMEEAHFFAPKERSGIGNENMAIYWAKMLATGGRSTGIRLIVATQRVQALHNALLGSCETIIVQRLTTPADQEPVQKWLKANVSDKPLITKIEAGMSSLPTGTGWVCAGEAKFFDLVQFPRIKTFDNSATPTKGSTAVDVTLPPVDREKLAALIGQAVAEIDANDPVKLKARIAQLEREAKAAPAATREVQVPVVDAAATAKAASEASESATQRAYAVAAAKLRQVADKLEERAGAAVVHEMAAALHNPPVLLHKPAPVAHKVAAAAVKAAPVVHQSPGHAADREQTAAAEGVSDSEMKILEALALCASIGEVAPSKVKLGIFAGYKSTGGRFINLLGSLRAKGLIDKRPDTVSFTEEGARIAPQPDLGLSARHRLAHMLTPSEAALLDALPQGGVSTTKEALAGATGYTVTGGRFINLMGRLRTLGLVDYPNSKEIYAHAWIWG